MTFYKELYAIPAFHHFLRKFWVLNNLANSSSSPPRFALPNGCFTLTFVSGEGLLINNAIGTLLVKEGIYLFGQLNSRLSISMKPFSKAIMAQMPPWAASAFTTQPLHEITNLFIEVQQANKELFDILRCMDLSDENQVINQFYKSFQPYLSQRDKLNLLEYMCEYIHVNTSSDAFRMTDLSERVGYSSRFIQKKFKNEIGLTPKEFYLILKMRNVLKELNAPTKEQSLTELALNYGFFDQSHFIKSFSGILLTSPKNYSPNDYILPLTEI